MITVLANSTGSIPDTGIIEYCCVYAGTSIAASGRAKRFHQHYAATGTVAAPWGDPHYTVNVTLPNLLPWTVP